MKAMIDKIQKFTSFNSISYSFSPGCFASYDHKVSNNLI